MQTARVSALLGHVPRGDAALHWLLGALALLVFVGEPLRSADIIGGWPQAVLLSSILVIGLLGLKSPRRVAWPIIGLGPLVMLTLAMSVAASPAAWRVVGGLLTALALALLAAALVQQVFAKGRVTTARIEGALALYLLAALVFALLYGVVEVASPGAFALGPVGQPIDVLDRRLLYFSLITQTSTGFGDIVPVHDLARSLATLQAVCGQIFTAVLLARLVALEIIDRKGG